MLMRLLEIFVFVILPSYCQSGVKSIESSMEADQKNRRKKGRKNICIYLARDLQICKALYNSKQIT